MLYDGKDLLCTAGGHVDDFIFTWKQEDARAQKAMEKMQKSFPWGEWIDDEFVQCGVEIKVTKDEV